MIRSTSLRIAAALVAVPALLAACGASGGAPASQEAIPSIPSLAPATPTAEPTHPGPTYNPGCPTKQPDALAAGEVRVVTIETDKGTMELTLTADLSPIAVGNFVTLAECGYYDNVVFHRVVPGFVIQGGDGQFGRSPDVIPDIVGSGGPPYRIKDEKVTTRYHRGTVAMARTMQPDSVGSQFFIVLDDGAEQALASYNTYQIIGEVTSGMDVADAIAAAANGSELPADPVVMKKLTVSTP